MKRIQLQESLFHVDPIKRIVGSGNRRAFQVFISKGNMLGLLGQVELPEGSATGNEAQFGDSDDAPARRGQSWIKRLLSALTA